MMREEATISSSEILCRIAKRLSELSASIEGIEQALGDILPPNINAGAIQRLQSLDQTRQSLQDLSQLVSILGSSATSESLCRKTLTKEAKSFQLEQTRHLISTSKYFVKKPNEHVFERL